MIPNGGPPRLAVVTGASSGIGAAFACALAERGYSLALVGRSAARLSALADDLAVPSHVLAADLADPVDLACVVDQHGDRARWTAHERLDAGAAWWGPFATQDEGHIDATLDLNITALVRLTRATIPAMLSARSGTILNVSSLASTFPQRNMAVYTASKAFVDSFSRSLRDELLGSGIAVTCVRPGRVRTDFHARSGEGDAHGGDWLAPEDVVAAALDAADRKQEMVSVPREPTQLRMLGWRLRRRIAHSAPDGVRDLWHTVKSIS